MKIGKTVLNFDYFLFFSMIALTIIGVFFIYSANLNKEHLQEDFLKQIIFTLICCVVFFAILFIPLKRAKEFSYLLYIICAIGLIATLFFPKVMGQRRFALAGISIQFSDFMKIAVTLFLAHFYTMKHREIKTLPVYLIGCAIVFFPIGVILLHPDLGSALVYIPILLAISYAAGVRKIYLLYTVLLFAAISFIPIITTINRLFFNNENEVIYLLTNVKYVTIIFSALTMTLLIAVAGYLGIVKGLSEKMRILFFWYIFGGSILLIGFGFSYPVNQYILKPYQKDRLLIFFNPYIDPKDKGYNIIQSMNTVGNGGLFGKGWKKGEQIQNFFLPEQATDFIYPVIGEEMGFIGSLLILFLYSIIFYRSFLIALNAKDYWSSYVVLGLLAMLLFHILENIGMCIGIMPITGIPLPFLSYGGSFLLSCFISIALIMQVNLTRFQY